MCRGLVALGIECMSTRRLNRDDFCPSGGIETEMDHRIHMSFRVLVEATGCPIETDGAGRAHPFRLLNLFGRALGYSRDSCQVKLSCSCLMVVIADTTEACETPLIRRYWHNRADGVELLLSARESLEGSVRRVLLQNLGEIQFNREGGSSIVRKDNMLTHEAFMTGAEWVLGLTALKLVAQEVQLRCQECG